MLRYSNLDQTTAFRKLAALKPFDLHAVSAARVERFAVAAGGGLTYHYGTAPIDDAHMTALQELADEQQLIAKYRALAGGAVMNTGENRLVLHHLVRGQVDQPVTLAGRDQGEFYDAQLTRFTEYADAVHSGSILSATGKRFETVVQVGIGGSDLGPRALYLALENYVRRNGGTPKLRALFISNVDPDDAALVLSEVDFETTLFIVVSKSGTTQETRTNHQFVQELAARSGAMDIRSHMIAVTAEGSPMTTGGDFAASFYIDDYIGGRYSATSAVGGVVLSLAFGSDVFRELIAGAHEADMAALEPQIGSNAALLDALIGVYQRNVLDMATTAVLPYSQALSRFPAHLQQLDMESNGKSVNRSGGAIGYQTGPIVFGEPGTNGQHSFYQLLHQGTTIVPLQFIGFRASQCGLDVDFEGSTSQTKLNANLAAQIVAFAQGKTDDNPNKNFIGGRPSTLLAGDQLTPRALGALLAHYENKVMFQGFVWNVNSFDQEGVQLGKVLTTQLLKGQAGPVLAAYARILGV